MEAGKEIKRIRQKHNLTQREMAVRLGISQPVLSLIEAGKTSLTIQNLKILSEQFGIDCMKVIFGDETAESNARRKLVPLINHQSMLRSLDGDLTVPVDAEYYRLPISVKNPVRMYQLDVSYGELFNTGDILIGEMESDAHDIKPGMLGAINFQERFSLFRFYPLKQAHLYRLVSENNIQEDVIWNRSEQKCIYKVIGSLRLNLDQEDQLQHDRLSVIEKELSFLKSTLPSFSDS